MSRKIFAVGDIHGCYDKLAAMMKILPWRKDEGDLLLFIGDYIDRGPKSREVVDFLVRLRQEGGEFVFLKGNHEKMLLDYYIQQKDQMLYVANGGAETIASYVEGGIGRKAFVLPEEHLEFFLSLTPVSRDRGLYFCSCGIEGRHTLDGTIRRGFALDPGRIHLFGIRLEQESNFWAHSPRDTVRYTRKNRNRHRRGVRK